MTSRFVALPVHQGDAFLLDRGDKTVLVDGGASKKGLVPLLDKYWEKEQRVIDVVVVTHNDLDHTGGIIGLLESNEYSVREMRLPVYWQTVFDAVSNHNMRYQFCLALVNLIRYYVVATGRVRRADIKELVEEVLKWETRNNRNVWAEQNYQERYDIKRILNIGEPVERTADVIERCFIKRVNDRPLSDTDKGRSDLLVEVMQRSAVWESKVNIDVSAWQLIELSKYINNITDVIFAAVRHNVLIRYYYHDHKLAIKSNKGDDFLLPVNAKEIIGQSCRTNNINRYTHFAAVQAVKSISNKYSIPFYAIETRKDSGVLFCAECCVSPNGMSPNRTVIAAGLHHGARDNSLAYENIKKWSKKVIWVRSDWKESPRPCQEYVDLLDTKYCTICNKPIFDRQAVELEDDTGEWVARSGVRTCSCMAKKIR